MAVVFFSYSHADADLRAQLERHLAALRRQKLIDGWYDGEMLAGDELDPTVLANLDRADVILLLVSADFINSDYCYRVEMERAFERHEAGEARVIPVILRDCDWKHPPISNVLVTPKDGRPVTSWANKDEALTDVAKQVRKAVEDMNFRRTGQGAAAASPESSPRQPASSFVAALFSPTETSAAKPPLPVPATLRISREFTDFDRDEFMQTSYEFIARYFEGALRDLAEANEGIQQRFQRVDARRFTAIIYRAGKSVAECTIRIDSMGGRSSNLAFSHNANAADGSSNEMLYVEHDTHQLYFKPLGMASFGQDANSRLDAEGTAEYLWKLFIRNLMK